MSKFKDINAVGAASKVGYEVSQLLLVMGEEIEANKRSVPVDELEKEIEGWINSPRMDVSVAGRQIQRLIDKYKK